MAQFRERDKDEGEGVPVDLDQKVCPSCRRKLQPWETTCPDDGAIPVEAVQMGAVEDGILGRLNPDLLADLDDPEPEAPEPEPDRVDDDLVEEVTTEAPPEDLTRPVNFDDMKWGGF